MEVIKKGELMVATLSEDQRCLSFTHREGGRIYRHKRALIASTEFASFSFPSLPCQVSSIPMETVPNPTQLAHTPSPPSTSLSLSLSPSPALVSRLKQFVTILFFAAVSVIVLGIIADIVIIWTLVNPRFPSFQVNSVELTSLNTTATNLELTASFDISVTIRNPNRKLSVSYDKLEVVVQFDNNNIASGFVEPFWQDVKSVEPVRIRLAADSQVLPRSMLDAIAAQRAHGEVALGMALFTEVRFWWHAIFRTSVRDFKLQCDPLHLVFPPNKKKSDIGRLQATSDCYLA
ncbi:hypothetical protein Fmac_027387 [Flemingia macrophylla]|uniref:Late embryogenesis abundant protein LEA-2 subgroup domain-containing protein n=1 Tax=Flemingia macrophylla TaxID=520843 RepID=A0ABD1LHJ4_9FABA